MTENKQYPELPDPTAWRSYDNLLKRARYDAVPITSTQPGIYSHTRMFTEDQTRAFADATCAMRAEQAAPASQDAEDAARYRYLKKYKAWDSTDVFYWLRCAPADEVDSIIDAARSAQGESNG